MRRTFLKGMLATLTFGWLKGSPVRTEITTQTDNPRTTPMEQDNTTSDPTSAAFTLDDLIEKQEKNVRPYLEFLDASTLNMGLYVLPSGGEDLQSPHKQDEVYVIEAGKAILDVEGKDHKVSKGSIVFVKARAKHHFHSIEEELKVLVFFSTMAPFASS